MAIVVGYVGNTSRQTFDIYVDADDLDDICRLIRRHDSRRLLFDTQHPEDNDARVWKVKNIKPEDDLRREHEFTYADLLKIFGVKRLFDVRDLS